MTKPFPLYDDLATLCDAVIATGAGAFRGTCDGSSVRDAEGSEDEEGRLDWPASEEEGLELFDNPVSNTPYFFMGLRALTCQVL